MLKKNRKSKITIIFKKKRCLNTICGAINKSVRLNSGNTAPRIDKFDVDDFMKNEVAELKPQGKEKYDVDDYPKD